MTENSDFWFDYDRTPRDVTDMNGRRLEIGEEPVKVTVFAPGFGRKYPWGHVQMEYEGLVIDFEAGGMRNLKADQPQIFEEGVRHYYVFPAAAGISRERLREAILRRRGQTGDYSLLSNNCADQVRTVMEEAGARGIKEFGPLEISVPERIGGWCAGRGVEIDVHTTNLYCFSRFTMPFFKASKFSSARSAFATPPLYFKARIVATQMCGDACDKAYYQNNSGFHIVNRYIIKKSY